MEQILNDSELEILRKLKKISCDEVVYRIGDLLVAENVLTKQRRKLTQENPPFSESRKRLLKG